MVALTVSQVVERDLCTGCGTCVSLCPKAAVSLFVDPKSQTFLVKVNDAICVNCGLCLRVCPGHAVDFAVLNKQFLDKDLPYDRLGLLLGNYLKCYIGYASDHHVRFDSSSGGIVTQLLIFALEEGIIDGALVTRMRKDNPLEPEPFIARTKQAIIEASKSKYCPVPANMALTEILEQDGKYAVVGLPCQLHGVRKAELLNQKLRDRIVLHIGLFCSGTDSFYHTQYLLYRWGIKPEDVAKIDYRGGGWPGFLTVTLKYGHGILTFPSIDWSAVHEFNIFTRKRCLTCCDHTAELSDISCGDAWLPELYKDTLGTSIFISRSDISEKLLVKAKARDKIKISSIHAVDVARSAGMVRFKKNAVVVRLKLFQLVGKATPLYIIKPLKANVVDIVRSCLAITDNYFGSIRSLWAFFRPIIIIEQQLKKLYSIVFNRKQASQKRSLQTMMDADL